MRKLEDELSAAQPEANDDGSFKVFVRVRPLLPREILNGSTFSIVDVKASNKTLLIYEYMNFEAVGVDEIREHLQNPKYYQIHPFNYDFIFNEKSLQEEVYEIAAKKTIDYTIKGYNSTVIAYGQTGTGKTFTMEGSLDSLGIIPQAIHDVFRQINDKNITVGKVYNRVSYLQIYNEIITDLLSKEKQSLMIREDRKKGIFVDSLSEWPVSSPEQIMKMMRRGAQSRPTASTKMNELSSRSHAIFIVIIERSEKKDGVTTHSIGKLNFVDLAGSERIRVTGATGQRLEECKKINQSLAALGNVISALSSKTNRSHIPYRDSKLTRLLEDSLGGNCKTTMIANISPAIESFNESISTLKFAARAKNIKNAPLVNGEIEYDPQVLLRKYEDELKNLQAKSFTADADRISDGLVAEAQLCESLAGKSLAEGKDFADNQGELDKYKGLLLRQRDIMIAMTSRLNNRDETIIGLQGEVESLNQRILDLENELLRVSDQDSLTPEEMRSPSSLSKRHRRTPSKPSAGTRGAEENVAPGSVVPDSVKSYADNLKSGLDLVINVLTKENAAIDLGSIAQKLLGLQSLSHKLHSAVSGQTDKTQQKKPAMPPGLAPAPTNLGAAGSRDKSAGLNRHGRETVLRESAQNHNYNITNSNQHSLPKYY